MSGSPPAAGRYLRFLAQVAGVTALVALLGALPTRRLGGEEAIPAMLAACAATVLASAIGALPVLLARGGYQGRSGAALNAVLGSMVLRLGATVFLVTLILLLSRLPRVPLLLWVALSYAAQLVVDTRYALGETKQ